MWSFRVIILHEFLDYTGPSIHKSTRAFVIPATSTTTTQSSVTCIVQSSFVILLYDCLACRYDNGAISLKTEKETSRLGQWRF